MNAAVTFDQVLDAVELLPDEQQADLVDLVRRRLALRRRDQLLADIREGREAFARGELRPATVEEIMRAINS